MALTGTRFDIDLSSDSEGAPPENPQGRQQERPAGALSFGSVGDVRERLPSKPPTAPTLTNSPSGFPAPKKRARVSVFKQQRAAPPAQPRSHADGKAGYATTTTASLPARPTAASASPAKGFEELERQRIDEENRTRLANMSDEEIARERQELLAGLSPSLLDRLLKRANLDDGRGDTG